MLLETWQLPETQGCQWNSTIKAWIKLHVALQEDTTVNAHHDNCTPAKPMTTKMSYTTYQNPHRLWFKQEKRQMGVGATVI
jgi:hypothetical protein